MNVALSGQNAEDSSPQKTTETPGFHQETMQLQKINSFFEENDDETDSDEDEEDDYFKEVNESEEEDEFEEAKDS